MLEVYRKARLEHGPLSPLGCLQAGPGCVFFKKYRPNGFIDYVLEGYSGVHDALNEPFFYTNSGFNRVITNPFERFIGKIINPANVVLATPIVVPSLVPDHMRHLYFQELDQ